MSIGRGFAGAVNLSEVEVDTRLGTVRVLRAWAGIAAGRIYSERLARSQCEGGVIQGVGYALFEQRHTDPATGTVLTGNLEDYRLPGIADTPEITVHFHQEGWDHVTGARRRPRRDLHRRGRRLARQRGRPRHRTGVRAPCPSRTDQLLEGIRAL